MANGKESAFGYGFCTADGTSVQNEPGLTKREYFAAMAKMPESFRIPDIDIASKFAGFKLPDDPDLIDQMKLAIMVEAKYKVLAADALIRALNETQNQ